MKVISRYKIKIQALFILLTYLSTMSVSAQDMHSITLDVPRVVPISPTATAMEKYQSYPVNYCTGIPNITIPLYEIVAGDITIPVTLTYHASGIKPKEESGIAGTGWTLNLEPSVGRQIKGTADDGYNGWFDRSSAPSGEREQLIYYGEMVDNKRDTQPDKFTYKLPNGGGSGYFLNRYSPLVTIPRNNDEVSYGGNYMDIKDENGIKYEFYGVNEKSSDIITRWLCTAMRSPHKIEASVTFSYSSTSNVMNPSSFYNLDNKLIFNSRNISGSDPELILTEQSAWENKHYKVRTYFSMGENEPYDAYLDEISDYSAKVNYPAVSRYVTGYMNTVQLENVNFMGNNLSATYKSVGTSTTHSKVIDTMKVRDEDGKLVRSIRFVITNYNNGTSLTKLDSVIISAPGAEDRVYAFRYKSPDEVTSIYTIDVDHWGFYNGRSNSKTVPSFYKQLHVPIGNWEYKKAILKYQGANREPDHSRTDVGVLIQIADPQGVETNFTYEGNYGAFRNSKIPEYDFLLPVGGLRVQRIETIDPKTNKRIVKRYKYGLTETDVEGFKPVWGGGAIKHIVTERDYQSSVTYVGSDQYSMFHWEEYLTTYHSMPISNITFNDGSAVQYSIVSEEVQGIGGDCITTLYYYNVSQHYYRDVLYWDYNTKDFTIAELLRMQTSENLDRLTRSLPGHPQEPSDLVGSYASTNQGVGSLARVERLKGDKPISTTEYTYDKKYLSGSNTSVDIPIRLLMVDVDYYMQKPSDLIGRDVYVANNYYPGGSRSTYYLDDSYYHALDSEVTKEFRTVNGKERIYTTEKKYYYDINGYDIGYSLKPKKVTTTNSNGVIIVDEYDYLYGFPGILSRHKHTEGNSWKENRILFKNRTVLPEKVQSRTNKSPEFRDEVIYTAYDTNNNVMEIKGKDGTPIVYLWGYRSQFPIAKIENATLKEVLLAMKYKEDDESIFGSWASMILPTTEAWEKINSLRTGLPNSRVTSYEYIPLQGVVSVTNPNSVTNKFEYDSYNRLTDNYYLDPDARKVMLKQHIYHLGGQ